jgi:hypothetical protein
MRDQAFFLPLVLAIAVSTTVANSILTVRNPLTNTTALTLTPNAGGAQTVSASVVILQLRQGAQYDAMGPRLRPFSLDKHI